MNTTDQSGQLIHAGWLHCSLANGDWAEPATLWASLYVQAMFELLCIENEVKDGLHFQWCYVLLHCGITKLVVIVSRHWFGHFLHVPQ
jgi:hypothetical protein